MGRGQQEGALNPIAATTTRRSLRRAPWVALWCAGLLLSFDTARAAAGTGISAPAWRDTYTTRLAALALLQSLNADLLSHDSATQTLERWCATHRLADPPRVIAERLRDGDKPATPEQRAILRVSADEPLRYRHVRLHCGAHALSEADNWYVPSRLTAEMNRTLDASDVPFGRAVQALQFQRQTLAATPLWSILPEGWEMSAHPARAAARTLAIPDEVLRHEALLALPDGTPISLVRETYRSEVFAFPQPAAPRGWRKH